MTAAVASLPSAIHDSFQSLKIQPSKAVHKDVYDSEEKKASRRRIFDTPYEPNLKWWTSNQAEYAKPANDPLPQGFPQKVVSKSVWDGKTLINQPENWLYTFTEEDVSLINKAYEHFQSLNITNNEIDQTTFPVPQHSALYKALVGITYELNHGLGLRVLRGLPVDEWTRSKQISVFAGISAYVSPRRIANNGNNIVHLRFVKGQTNGNQVFHNDGSLGIISLFTLGVAETGGLSQLASVGQTYNYFAENRRDILRELAKNDWKNRYQPEGRPLIHPVGKDQVISVYSRRPYFGFYGADEDVEPLPTEKHLALDAIHFTAEKFSLDLDLQKGDLEYVNNVTVYHARTSSEDSEKNQRHLIRLWLDNEEQPLPEILVDEFRKTREGKGWPQEAWDSLDEVVNRNKE
uniref:TauD/TfdA-like domain-containing protein n=1 Tax=Kwoniella dejecticola CBS 10117 TaxID=1296121 RepID=A0A1A5ZYD4_9TREE|nr:uncharacterized protein I303_06350 [Kwoniella dejecticola CBS 10117]OBR82793.1 hypothetical protein I303_06350 [Kwoniella dejecticola CBS 10117]